MNIFNNAITIEQAARLKDTIVHFEYNDSPVISKNKEFGPLQMLKPVQAFDNVYWAGCKTVGSVIIDTGDGYIMIDDGSNSMEGKYIADSMKELGLEPSDVKMILISHEHFDHYGGTTFLLNNVCPDAKAAMSKKGWNLLQTVPTEFAFTCPRPERVDILLTDDMVIKHGNTNIRIIETPGHSDGCVSLIFNSTYMGREIMVGMMGGSGAWPNLPQLRMYQNSVELFKKYCDMAGCNAFIAAHQREAAIEAVRASWKGDCENPWICDAADFDAKYLDQFRANAKRSLLSDGLQCYMMPPPPGKTECNPEGSPVPERL